MLAVAVGLASVPIVADPAAATPPDIGISISPSGFSDSDGDGRYEQGYQTNHGSTDCPGTWTLQMSVSGGTLVNGRIRMYLTSARDGSSHKTIVHPVVGPIALDCDVLTVTGTDIRIVVYTAEPSTADAEKLDLVRIIGLQSLARESEHAAARSDRTAPSSWR